MYERRVISNKEIFHALLYGVFHTCQFNRDGWDFILNGKEVYRENKFFEGRKDKPIPLNAMAAERIYTIYELCFLKHSPYRPSRITSSLSDQWRDLFDIDLSNYIVGINETETRYNDKISALLHIIQATMDVFIDKKEVYCEEIQYIADNIAPEGSIVHFLGDGTSQIKSLALNIKNIFIGREEEMAKILSNFKNGKTVQFLEGYGGFGKSELAKQFAFTYKDQYKVVVLLKYNDSISNSIADDKSLLINGVKMNTRESVQTYAKRKLKALKTLLPDNSLIILDGFNASNDPMLEDLISGNCHVLIPTRYPHSDYHTEHILPLKEDAALDIFIEVYNATGHTFPEEETEYVKQILAEIEYNTLAIEILAVLMRDSWISGKEVLDLLDPIKKENENKKALQGVFALFDISNLTDKELYVMKNLAVLGSGGIHVRTFRDWVGIDEFKEINDLISHKWLRSETAWNISMHTLVWNTVFQKCRPTAKNCRNLIANISERCYNAWHYRYAENYAILKHVKAILKYIGITDEVPVTTYTPIISYLWQVGQFNLGIKYGEQLYNLAIRIHGNHSFEAAVAAEVTGGCYYNSLQYKHAYEWYERAYEIIKDFPDRYLYKIEYATIMEKRAKGYLSCLNFGQAHALLDQVITIRRELLELAEKSSKTRLYTTPPDEKINMEKRMLARAYMEKGNAYMKQKLYFSANACYEMSEMYYEKCHKTEEKTSPEVNASRQGFGILAFFRAKCFLVISKIRDNILQYSDGHDEQDTFDIPDPLELAVLYAQMCHHIRMEYRVPDSFETANTLELMGDVSTYNTYIRNEKDFEMAISLYQESLDILNKIKEHGFYVCTRKIEQKIKALKMNKYDPAEISC